MKELRLPLSLPRVVSRYVHAFAPESIVLFGSYAKRTNKPGSDVDLLIVADLDGEASTHLRRAHQLAVDCFPPVDVVFATPEDVENATAIKDPFLLSVLGSGIPIYQGRIG